MNHKDMVGADVRVGSKVAYGVRDHNHGKTVVATVDDFDTCSWSGRPLLKLINIESGKTVFRDPGVVVVYG